MKTSVALTISLSLLLLAVQQAGARASFDKAVALFNAGQYSQALPILEACYAQHPDANTAYYRAVTLERLGQRQNSADAYRKITQEFPDTQAAAYAQIALSTRLVNALTATRNSTLQTLAMLNRPAGGSLPDMAHINPPTLAPAKLPDSSVNGQPPTFEQLFPNGSPQIPAFLRNDPRLASVMPRTEAIHLPKSEKHGQLERKVPQGRPPDLKSLPEQAIAVFNYENNRLSKDTVRRMIIKCQIDEHPIDMQLDTGACDCIISSSDLNRIGIKLPKDTPETALSGFGGRTVGYTIYANVTVGELCRRVPLCVVPSYYGKPLIGYSFLYGFDYMVDAGHQKITFIKEHNFGKPVALSDPNSIAFNLEGDKMIVAVEIDGVRRPMIWDTGADAVTMTESDADAFHLHTPDYAKSGTIRGIGGRQSAKMFNASQISVGPLVRRNVPIIVISSGPSVLGQSFLQRCNYTVDLTHRRLILPRPE